jgi:hypothetical protein
MRPLAQSTPGTMLIGLVRGVLVGVMMAVGLIGLPWNSTHTMMIRYLGGFGAIGALVFRWRATRR